MKVRARYVALAVLATACDQDPRPSGWEDVSGVTLPCQIDESRCRTAIFQAVAKLRDQLDASLPKIRLITRQQYVDELNGAVGGAEEDPRSARFSTAMGLFNTIAKEQTLAEADADSSAVRVLAYYDHRAKDITVISDNASSAEAGSSTLAHEIVHALQDQRENLSQLDRDYARNWDSMVAVDALVEGEAMWLEKRFEALAAGEAEPDRDYVDAYFGDWIHGTLQSIDASDSPLVVAQQLLPYGFGGARVSDTWYDEGGDDAVSSLYDQAGVTFARWVGDAAVNEPDADICVVPRSGPGGRSLELLDSFGIPGMLALYAGLGHDADEILTLARGWRADWFAMYTPEQAGTREVAAVWRVKLDSPELAAQLAEEASATLGAITDTRGDEVSLFVGTDAALVDELRDAVPCTTATSQGARLVAARELRSADVMARGLRGVLHSAHPR
jgi:hypothetical protein